MASPAPLRSARSSGPDRPAPRHRGGPCRPAARRLRQALTASAAVSLLGLLAVGSPAGATGFVVTTTADGGAGSLRDAITQANAHPGADLITIPPGHYTLSIAGVNENVNATGDLDLSGDVTLVGTGGAAVTTIDAAGIDRVFDVQAGSATFEGLTITGGNPGTGSSGGDILEGGNANVTVQDSVVTGGDALVGGGIAGSAGTLQVIRSEIVDNTVTSIPGNGSLGGGIAKTGNQQGSLQIIDSLLADNHTTDGNAGALYASTTTTITNTTISGNTMGARAVYFEAYGSAATSATLTNVTIAGNVAAGYIGAGVYVNVIAPATMPVTFENTLLSANTANGMSRDCGVSGVGAITSAGHNLADDATCTSFTQPTDLSDDAGTTLAALANNGGPTRTRALLAGSSAIDAAGACGVKVPTDQRGAARPAGAACDIGAFELAGVIPPTTTTTSTSSTSSSTTSTSTSSTTSTTAAPTTTSTAAPTANSTAAPTTTSTAAPTTTTTAAVGPAGSTTSTSTLTVPLAAVAGDSIVPQPVPATGTLPVTGSGTVQLVLLAAFLLSVGGLIVLAARHLAGRRLESHLDAERPVS